MGIAVLDSRLRLLRVNRALGAVHGLVEEEVLGRRVEEALPMLPADLIAAMRKALRSGEARHQLEARAAGADGAVRHVEVGMTPMAGGRGRPASLLLTLRDVTARRRAEREEREARGRAEATADRLWRLQQATAALSAAATSEEVAEAVFQVALDALDAGGGSLSFPSGNDLVQVAHTAGFLEAGEPPEVHPVSLRVALADAFTRLEPVWIESAADLTARYPRLVEPGHLLTEGAWAALPLVVRGRPLGVLGLGFGVPRRFSEEDRTFARAVAQECAQAIERARLHEEQRRLRSEAEAAAEGRERLLVDLRRTLRERDESAALLDAFFGNAPLGLALLDPDMRIVRLNRALAAMNGLTLEEHLGRTVAEILPGLPLDELARSFQRILATGEPLVDLEVEGETPAAPGERRAWLGSWYPVTAGEQVIGVGVLVREVTAQKRAAQFQQRVLSVVGHDLRSPLLAITSSAAVLQHVEPLSEGSARAVGRIISAATRMDGIVRALADYTRVQVGQGIPLERRQVDLRAICREVVEEAEATHPDHPVRCEVAAGEQGEWDPDRLGQVVANLVGNALDYGAPRTPVLISCRGEPAEVLLEVSNQGPPIPDEFRPFLFEPFRRAPGAERLRRGLGLGLFIARQIAQAHGGSIEARSGADGTVFSLRLPRRQPAG